MELVDRKWLQLYTGRCNRALAEKVSVHLGVELGEANLIDFANGEIGCHFGTSVRGADTFILQTHGRPVNDSIMEQLIMIDAAKRASARQITAVCPYYGYSRQDRKAEGREPITAKLVADLFTAAGAGRIISVDLHAGQLQGFFDGPVDHLTAMPVFVRHLRGRVGDGLVVVAPDAGRFGWRSGSRSTSRRTSPSCTSVTARASPAWWRPARWWARSRAGPAWWSTT